MKNRSFALRLSSFILLVLIVGFSSCKKDKFEKNSTGKTVLSETDLLNLNTIDTTITLVSYPVLSDSVRTDEVSVSALLGSYVDPVFGKTEASIFTQFRFVEAQDFSSVAKDKIVANLVVDSVLLSMPISEYYGTLDPQTFEVYQMSEDIDLASNYYSNKLISTSVTNLVEAGKDVITPNAADGILNISLNTSIGSDIIAQNGLSTLSSNDDFVSWFKGLHIKTNTSQVSGEGAILSLLMNGSDTTRLTVYYRSDAASDIVLEYEMIIDANVARFNHFNHDYTSTSIQSALDDTEKGNTEFYIQSLGGVNTEITFPYLSNLSKIDGFVVRKAELILPFESDATYSETENLIALGFNSEGQNVPIIDQFIGSVGGTVNTADKNYTFSVTNFINRLVNGSLEDNRLLIKPVGSSVNPNRVVFNGQKSAKAQKIELKISYTIF